MYGIRPLPIIFEDEDLVVVDKPPSIPSHPCGAYHFNSIPKILEKEQGYSGLKLLHRLDKLTSGVLMFTRNAKNANSIQKKFETLKVGKMYYARVSGNVQFDHFAVNKAMRCISRKHCQWDVIPGKEVQTIKNKIVHFEILFEKPEDSEKTKLATKKNDYKNNFKESLTVFEKIFYDKSSDTSLLKCFPKNGRTHQIRVHLKSIGHSIINDVPYGGKFVGNFFNKKDPTKNAKNKNTKEEVLCKRNSPSDSIKKTDTERIDKNDINFKFKKDKVNEIWLHSSKYEFDKYIFSSKDPFWISKNIENILKTSAK